MRIFVIALLLFSSQAFSDESKYRNYTNTELGVSFEYPSWAEIEDLTIGSETKVWFHVGQWRNGLNTVEETSIRPSVSGVLFEIKNGYSFNEFIDRERGDQIKGGYEKEITETKYNLGDGLFAVEFVRDNGVIRKRIYYYIFPSLKKNVALTFWHVEDTSTGFMSFPEEEAKALAEYRRMIATLRLSR